MYLVIKQVLVQHQPPGTTEDLNQAGVLWTIGPEQRLEETVAEGVKQEGMFFEGHFLWLLPFCLFLEICEIKFDKLSTVGI